MTEETGRAERRLAAVLAADIAGYSSRVERDEAGTLARLRAHRQEAVLPLLAHHRGRLVNLMGDGVLAEFASVVDAVDFALAMQARTTALEVDRPEADRMSWRIGLNLGDVVVEAGDIFGEGVNLAARLEQAAEPGGVLISGTVYDHLQGRLGDRVEYLGERKLRNLDRPARVYRLLLDGDTEPGQARSRQFEKPSVAVLPFTNMSGDHDQAWLSDGITEDIITELSRFHDLLVIARNSSFAYRDRAVDVREVGRGLGARFVVEGSVRRAGPQIRITAQLIDAETGAHLWAERYDRPLDDVFAVQDEIAQSIVAIVAARVIEAVEAEARRRPRPDVRAYELVLQARRLSDDFSPGAQEKAFELLERARTIDPTFARAYTGLAFMHLNRALAAIGVPREQDPNRIEALRLAEQGIALDPADPRVHHSMGYIALTWRDFARASRHLDLAREMNPNDPQIQIAWGWLQACLGEAEKGLPAAERALRLNPRYPRWYEHYRSRILLHARRHAEAAQLLEQLVARDPLDHPRDLCSLAAAYGHLGCESEARKRGAQFLEAIARAWKGDPAATAAQQIDWLVDASYLQRPEDEAHLREGLRRAGLPA